MSGDHSDLGDLKGILDRVQQWTAAADQKTEVLAAIGTLVAGFLLPEVVAWLKGVHTSRPVAVLLHASLALLAGGVVTSVLALVPRTDPKRRTPPSLTFFGTIESLGFEEYQRRLVATDESAWRADYAGQIYECSVIASQKYRLLKVAIKVFGSGLALLLATYIGALGGL